MSDIDTEQLKKAETEQQTDKKCASCGGTMDFDPATGGLLCPYCGSTKTVESEAHPVSEADFNTAEADANFDWGVEKKTVICKSCGAETVYDSLEMAGECPYCGSNQVMESEKQNNTIAPGGVCPFKVDKKQAGANFIKWIKGKLFCPSKAKKMAKPDAFKGVYLPYWTFDSDTYSIYTARYGIDRTTTNSKGESVTTTDWYKTRGDYSEFINDQAVMASTHHDPSMLSRIEPFDTENNVAYKPEYVAGFASERYSLGLKDAWERAKNAIKSRLASKVESKVRSEHRADHVADVQLNTEYSDIKYKYLLLPVWMSSFKYKNKIYQFLVNGQTGKVGGKAPVSPLRVAVAILIALAIIAIIYFVTQ